MQPDLTPKQQTSEALRQGETILITAGQHPTIDQVSAVLALTAILRKFGKKVSAVISDPLPSSLNFLETATVDKSLNGLRDFIVKLDLSRTEVDKLRYEVKDGKLSVFITPFAGGFSPSDVTYGYGDYHFDLVVVLGVTNRTRLDRVFSDNPNLFSNLPVVNIDNHRSNENYGAVNLIEPIASSLCEILVALSESLQTGLIDTDIATTMLTGLIASTDRFGATHTTSKSLTVAAQLMAAGGRQQAVMKGLYGGGRTDTPQRQERAPREGQAERSSREGSASSNRSSYDRGTRNEAARNERHEQSDKSERGERPDRSQPTDRSPRNDAAAVSSPISPAKSPESPTSTPTTNLVAPIQKAQTQASGDTAPLVYTSISGPFERAHEDADVTPILIPSDSNLTEDGASEEPLAFKRQPIIEPQHVELDRAHHISGRTIQSATDTPHLADFDAAIEVLRRQQAQSSDGPLSSSTETNGDEKSFGDKKQSNS